MTESQEQKKLMKWIETYHPELWEVTFHVPNERKRSGRQIGDAIAMGLRSGVPDVFIDHPLEDVCKAKKDQLYRLYANGYPDLSINTRRNGYHGLRIELKRSDGGRLSQPQRKWLERLNSRGYLAVCCHGFEEAKKVIEDYVSE